MQGLPFDDAEFPPPVSTVTSSWDQSPRIPMVPQPTNQAAPVTDEELYRLVGAPPPSPPAPSDELIRFSQQISLPSPPQHLPNFPQQQQQQQQQQQPQPQQQQQHQPQYSQSQQTHSRQPQDIPYRSIPHPQIPHRSRIPVSAAQVQQTTRAQMSRTRRRSSIARSRQQQSVEASRTGASHAPMHMRVVQSGGTTSTHAPAQVQSQAHLSRQTGVSPGMSVSASGVSTYAHVESLKRPRRSAVEEARLRAQKEAETFASSRRDNTKVEASLQSTGKSGEGTGGEGGSSIRQSNKRIRVDNDPNSSNEYHSSRKKGDSGDEGRTKEDESEAEKKERYKRRLDMNRESAAVSRVRRRAYVKELEERLAAVEAEKLQLEGKLEIMMSQNESLKKQLENLFLMVASGRRPTYPGQASGTTNTQAQGGAPPSGTGGEGG